MTEGWLPPKPPGSDDDEDKDRPVDYTAPPPSLWAQPQSPQAPPPQAPQPPQTAPPPAAPPPAYQPPPPQAEPPPPVYQPPAAQPGDLPPPPPPQYGQQPQAQYPQAPQPLYRVQEPGNPPAVGGLVCSLIGLGTLVMFVGILFPVSMIFSIVGIVLGRKGMSKVDRGETTKQRSLAKGGLVLGIIGLVLSLVAAAIVIALFVADPNWIEDLDTDSTGDGEFSTLIAILAGPR